MNLFGKKEKKQGCAPNCNNITVKAVKKDKENCSQIKILGGGCSKCNQLEANTKEALKQLGMDIEIEHVKDFAKIASYGVMTTPALVYNGKVLCFGTVLKTEKIVDLLKKEV